MATKSNRVPRAKTKSSPARIGVKPDLYQVITDKVIELLEAGTVPESPYLWNNASHALGTIANSKQVHMHRLRISLAATYQNFKLGDISWFKLNPRQTKSAASPKREVPRRKTL